MEVPQKLNVILQNLLHHWNQMPPWLAAMAPPLTTWMCAVERWCLKTEESVLLIVQNFNYEVSGCDCNHAARSGLSWLRFWMSHHPVCAIGSCSIIAAHQHGELFESKYVNPTQVHKHLRHHVHWWRIWYLEFVDGAEGGGALDALEGLRDLVDVLHVRVQVRPLPERRRAHLLRWVQWLTIKV